MSKSNNVETNGIGVNELQISIKKKNLIVNKERKIEMNESEININNSNNNDNKSIENTSSAEFLFDGDGGDRKNDSQTSEDSEKSCVSSSKKRTILDQLKENYITKAKANDVTPDDKNIEGKTNIIVISCFSSDGCEIGCILLRTSAIKDYINDGELFKWHIPFFKRPETYAMLGNIFVEKGQRQWQQFLHDLLDNKHDDRYSFSSFDFFSAFQDGIDYQAIKDRIVEIIETHPLDCNTGTPTRPDKKLCYLENRKREMSVGECEVLVELANRFKVTNREQVKK